MVLSTEWCDNSLLKCLCCSLDSGIKFVYSLVVTHKQKYQRSYLLQVKRKFSKKELGTTLSFLQLPQSYWYIFCTAFQYPKKCLPSMKPGYACNVMFSSVRSIFVLFLHRVWHLPTEKCCTNPVACHVLGSNKRQQILASALFKWGQFQVFQVTKLCNIWKLYNTVHSKK